MIFQTDDSPPSNGNSSRDRQQETETETRITMTRGASRANEERYERTGTYKRNVLLTNQASNKRRQGERGGRKIAS